jgi:predicted nucleotidyltransferase
MQALSSYNPESSSAIERALSALQDETLGFSASPWYSERGLFARFVWPDWPEHLQKGIAEKIDDFHREHLGVQRVAADMPEWQAVFRDWRTDPQSASVIAEAFSKHFPGRVRWVESEKDARGRIAADCDIKGAGEITLHLFWRDSSAFPGPLSDADRHAFQASIQAVFEWASSRIRPILDVLHDRLKSLYGERFRGLYVFGSYARPDAGIDLGENSDLDVALILSDFDNVHEEREHFGDLTYDLSLEHGLVISVVPIREADFREGQTNFTRVISQYAVPVK